MAKRVFFSFHYQDVIDFRVNVVRNHWVTKLKQSDAGFFDASLWEDAKKTSDLAIKRLINNGLENTSVTCVLIGSQTFNRRWVKYEIIRSIAKGPNPFYYLGYKISEDGKKISFYNWIDNKWVAYTDMLPYTINSSVPVSTRGIIFRLSSVYPVYDWIGDNGYERFSSWVN